jgi:hypothetical protein
VASGGSVVVFAMDNVHHQQELPTSYDTVGDPWGPGWGGGWGWGQLSQSRWVRAGRVRHRHHYQLAGGEPGDRPF